MSQEVLSPQFVIEEARVADAEALAAMHNQSWIDTYTDLDGGSMTEFVMQTVEKRGSPEGIDRRREQINDAVDNENKFYYVARTMSGEIAGMMTGERSDGEVEMGGLYVDRKHHGKGFAKALWEQFLQWADGADITLQVAVGNERAIAFYTKVGFERVPGSEMLFKDVMPVFTMLRKGAAV